MSHNPEKEWPKSPSTGMLHRQEGDTCPCSIEMGWSATQTIIYKSLSRESCLVGPWKHPQSGVCDHRCPATSVKSCHVDWHMLTSPCCQGTGCRCSCRRRNPRPQESLKPSKRMWYVSSNYALCTHSHQVLKGEMLYVICPSKEIN